jgi:threonylcarbamoyladenosine tRNA methylthiotransferase MtaB
MTSSNGGKDTRVALYTLGCKLNQAETEFLAGQFTKAGYQLVAPTDMADIYIANTCTVTHIADRKSRHWLRQVRRRNPEALVIATGCYAQRAPQELAQIADLVINNKEKELLLDIIKGLPLPAPFSIIARSQSPRLKLQAGQSHTHYNARVRSMVRIQDGCCTPCTYCIVPLVRAHEYSLPAPQIMEEIKEKVAAGYREVVLTGTNIGRYKDDGTNLEDLLVRILHDTNIQRLHLSSLQPQEISSRFLALWQDTDLSTSEKPQLCRHFHLALQSGSDTVLQRMKRRYSLDDYQAAVSLIRETIPGAAITTDIMVGFPGENDEEFEESYRFCQQAGFANIHVFPFSPRPGTEANKMPNQVKDQVKRERARRMLKLAEYCRYSFCQQFLGQTMPVLWERETNLAANIYSGLTDNYIKVFAHSEKILTNTIVPAKLASFHNKVMWGKVSGENPS